MTAFSLSPKDRTGALNSSFGASARAGVYITAIDALAVGEKFGAYLWVSASTVRKASRALRAR